MIWGFGSGAGVRGHESWVREGKRKEGKGKEIKKGKKGREGIRTHSMSNHGPTHSSHSQTSRSSSEHTTLSATLLLLLLLLYDLLVPAAVTILMDVFGLLAVVSALCALLAVTVIAVTTDGWTRGKGAVRCSRWRVAGLRGLRKIPLGAAGGLFEVVPSLAVLVPLGGPAGWKGRACGGGWCVRRRGSTVTLVLAVLRLLVVLVLVVGSVLVVGAEVFGTYGERCQVGWDSDEEGRVYRHAYLPFSRLSSCRRRRRGPRSCRPFS